MKKIMVVLVALSFVCMSFAGQKVNSTKNGTPNNFVIGGTLEVAGTTTLTGAVYSNTLTSVLTVKEDVVLGYMSTNTVTCIGVTYFGDAATRSTFTTTGILQVKSADSAGNVIVNGITYMGAITARSTVTAAGVASFLEIRTPGQITNSVTSASGNAPLVIASTVPVANLFINSTSIAAGSLPVNVICSSIAVNAVFRGVTNVSSCTVSNLTITAKSAGTVYGISVPVAVGELAVDGVTLYISTGTSNAFDWVKVGAQ